MKKHQLWTFVRVLLFFVGFSLGQNSLRGYNEDCNLYADLDAQAINVLDSKFAAHLKGVSAAVIDVEDWLEDMDEVYVSELMSLYGVCDPNQLLSCLSIPNEDSPEGPKRILSGPPPKTNNLLGVPDVGKEYILACRCNPVLSSHAKNQKTGAHHCLAFHGQPCEYKAVGVKAGIKQYRLTVDYGCVNHSLCEAVLGIDKVGFGDGISATAGTPLRSSGFRRSFIRVMESHTIKICLCDAAKGYKHDGRGHCSKNKNSAMTIHRPITIVLHLITLFVFLYSYLFTNNTAYI